MSRVCHECGRNVENPFYDVSANLYEVDEGEVRTHRLAQSDMSCSLCASEYRRIEEHLTLVVPEGISFVVDGAEGGVGGFSGTVQLSGYYETDGKPRYLSKEDAKKFLPKAFMSLTRNPYWVEKDKDGKWHGAEWAPAPAK